MVMTPLAQSGRTLTTDQLLLLNTSTVAMSVSCYASFLSYWQYFAPTAITAFIHSITKQ